MNRQTKIAEAMILEARLAQLLRSLPDVGSISRTDLEWMLMLK